MLAPSTMAERFAFGHAVEIDRPHAHVLGRPMTALVGRLLLAAIFLTSGVAKLVDTAGTAGYMESQGIPAAPTLAVIAGIAEIAGGLSLVFGLLARVGALGLIALLAVITFVFHDFWAMTGPEAKMQMVQFFKNLAIMGGLATIVAHGAGRYSLDTKLHPPQD